MKENWIVYGMLIVVIGILVFSFTGFSISTKADTTKITRTEVSEQEGNTFEPIDSGSTGMGDVSVELTPMEIVDNQLRVKISANTHSVSLGQFDLKEITTLEYKGKSTKPISAPTLDGHHSNGELVFNVDERIDAFIIRIRGIPNVEERVFEWRG